MGSIDGEESMEASSGHEEKIFVSVRVRPLNEKEIARNEVIDWECINENTIIYKNNFSPERSLYPTSYTFDRAFRPDCTTRQVYKEGAKAVVLSVVSGINSSVFAYGQTSSGKTYTMTGITEYTMQDIFEYIQKHKEREFQLKFSAMEIYNESVRDLLIANGGQLRLLDDPERGTVVEKLTEETLRDWNHFKDLLSVCEAQRQIGETFLNEASSRSHQILRLTIESSAREFSGKSNSGVLAATLNFVDLAGSERASQALSAGSRLKEGSHINRSLLSLGTVIRKLSKGRTGHVPYRDSKLTRILHSSLGGNARTAIICTLSPARSYVEQSRNTLVFASCAKEVMTNAQVNVVMTDKALVKQLQKELARLESELKSASPSVRTDTVALLREKDHQIEELERRVRELTMQLNLALSRTQDLHQGVGDDRNPTWEGQDSNYPKLHVRQASESSQSETFSMSDHHSIGPGSRVTEKSISPDRHSRSSYSENYILSSEFEEDLPPTSPFERMFIETPSDASPMMLFETSNSAKTDYYRVSKRNTEWTPDSIEILPYQVSEVKGDQTPGFVDFDPYQVSVSEGLHEETPNSTKFDPYHVSDAKGGQTPNYVESYPYRVHNTFEGQTSHTVEFDPYHEPEGSRHNSRIDPREVSDSEAMRDQYDENLEDFCKEVQCIESEESMANNVKSSSLSIEGNKEAFPVTGHGNSQTTDQDAVISSVRQDGELGHGEPSIWGHSPEDSTWQEKDSVSECKKIDAIESKGCDTVISTSSSYQEKVVKCEAKDETEDPIASQREFIVELDDIQKKLHALRSDEDGEILSGRALQNSVGMATLDEIQTPNREVSCDIEIRNSGTPVTEIKEMTQFPHKKQLSDSNVGDTLQKTNTPVKNVKDVGLNPPEDVDSCMWPTDFKKLQREIIDLWHACHVSLVHRTSFFLLFVKGDPTDIVYMEVERRRLSFLKDAFSSGNSTILDGRQLNPDSSKRRLHLEREMLSKLIKKRLSIQERNHLYVKWGINIDTKKRCSQLAHRLWTEPNDMDHIVKSANLVAKLVKFTDPPVPKEMLGLNLMPSQQVRKSHWWIPSPRGLI